MSDLTNNLISEKELRHGSIYEFSTPDGNRTAEVDFSEQGYFRIWFNGEFIHTSKTFKSLQKRLVLLASTWDLRI